MFLPWLCPTTGEVATACKVEAGDLEHFRWHVGYGLAAGTLEFCDHGNLREVEVEILVLQMDDGSTLSCTRALVNDVYSSLVEEGHEDVANDIGQLLSYVADMLDRVSQN